MFEAIARLAAELADVDFVFPVHLNPKVRGPAHHTLASHASILTGRYPPGHGVRSNGGYRLASRNVSIAEVLRGALVADYWDVELVDGGIFRIFYQRATGEWYADGIYD